MNMVGMIREAVREVGADTNLVLASVKKKHGADLPGGTSPPSAVLLTIEDVQAVARLSQKLGTEQTKQLIDILA